MYYVTQFGVPPKHPGRNPCSSSSQLDQQFDNTSHFVKNTNNNKRIRCVMAACISVGRIEFSKCDVGLCVSCFIPYHTK